ncbi:ATP-binding cassette domain-containing protein [Jiella sp. MQZ9-1]|uniref:ATP-binding cassette domain-containing protein n=1 Tax=Jiella flava TaxID=2816857 RepID=A0A939JSL1_9HYPH|nr:ATP-binding cassette domain-containing protein [Jiella flava]MBO0661205.1 ATP-binding cassette domain-containing protein [Jiella flava]MCD2469850.1 ATP-binding cassette domain-containing protein [Jiella flava]
MRALGEIMVLLVKAAPMALLRGAALSVVVLVMGAALLGLSGWFITATGIAGIAGIGIAFNVFQPSAGVRFLALGRTAARYGERLLTHDATLRALAKLRVDLMAKRLTLGARALAKLRSEAVLTRIVADVDALDGVVLRLLLPSLAAVAAHAVAFASLGLLAGWEMAGLITLIYLVGGVLVLSTLTRRTIAVSRDGETASQSLRRGIIDTLRDRPALTIYGRLSERLAELARLDIKTRSAADSLDRDDRMAGLFLALVVTLAAAAALALGGWLVANGRVDPAVAAIGVFVALALGETVLPLMRGASDLGRMASAAERIRDLQGARPASGEPLDPSRAEDGPPALTPTPATPAPASAQTPALAVAMPDGPRFTLMPGESACLVGPSGAGKTTLLLTIAGLIERPRAEIRLFGRPLETIVEAERRKILVMVPQRSALLAGTVRDNLTLPGSQTDARLWEALQAVELTRLFEARNGLDTRLGEAGAGLSGGEARRLALARAILCAPQILLLDEPTEGLDAATSQAVLAGIQGVLPDTAILAVMHRGQDAAKFSRQIALIGASILG